MATARLIPSAYTCQTSSSGSSYFSVSNASNCYANTDSTNYATFQTSSSSTSSRYIYLKGFNFSTVPSNATISSFTVKVKAYGSGLSSSAAYPCLCNNTTQISSTNASTRISSSTQTITIPTGNMDWATLKGYGSNLAIRLDGRRSNRNQASYVYVYGAEINVTYTAETIHVTGVSLNKSSTSIEEGQTETLTATVSPSNASDMSVSWSSSNTSVATVDSNGVVNGVSAGTATITVTTTDGGKTDACTVTVTAPVYTQYRVTDTMTAGKSYLIGNGNSGSIYLLSNEANGSRKLKGVAATVTDGIVSITGTTAAKCLFDCVEYTSGNSITTTLTKDGKYLYTDNSTGLRMNTVTTLDRFWHYIGTKFWQFKSSSSNGYSDTSSEYKYYLTWSNGDATDNHVSTTSIESSNIPATYFFEEYTPSDTELYVKSNGSWVQVTAAYKKTNGSWVQQSDLTSVFEAGVNYVKGN